MKKAFFLIVLLISVVLIFTSCTVKKPVETAKGPTEVVSNGNRAFPRFSS